MPAQRTTVAAIALGSGLLATRAFVPGVQVPVAGELAQAQALRGAAASSTASGAAEGSAALLGLGAATVLTAMAVSRRKARTALRAEPVSAAAAAAAAAKAAGAAGAAKAAGAGTAAVKTGTAVAGSAGTGSLKKSADASGKPGSQGSAGGFFDPASQVGVTAPLGYFDPAGFCKKGDEKSFRNFRAAEIKHGRVAMMASLGAVVQHFVKFPGFGDVPSGLAAANTAPGSYGFVALFAVAGILELGPWSESEDKEPGNFGDPVGLNQYTEDMRNRELNNGRFSMFAAIGIIAAELYTGKDAIEQFS